MVPVLGIGAEYGFENGLGIRAEITRFDSDVTYTGFGAIYRFGISPKGVGRMIASAAEPALAAAHGREPIDRQHAAQETIVERYAGPNARPSRGAAPHLHYSEGAEPDAAYVGTMAERWRPAMRADDRDVDGVLDNLDSCPDTAKHVTVDRYGCGLFDAVLHEVTFKSGSRWLTPRARKQLDLLAQTLLTFPEARVQIRAHTDSVGPSDENLGLSSRRAEVVVQYLQSRGVHELQLQAVGLGEAQPLDTNRTAEGRKRNRRVDVVTLPDQDAGQLLFASNIESGAVMSTFDSSRAGSLAAASVPLENWNSAANRASHRTKKPTVSEPSSNEPPIFAAIPSPTNRKDKIANASVVNTRVAPLPIPGFAPNFAFSGVLEDVTFDGGESVLSTSAQMALQPLLDELLVNPSVRVAIMAHTDNLGSVEDNKVLSSQRAEAVKQHLIHGGIDSERLKAEGYGELLPLVQNLTDADRERNRRIEIRVMNAQ